MRHARCVVLGTTGPLLGLLFALAVLAPVAEGASPGGTAPSAARRGPDGDGSVRITGELKRWHKVTLTLAGPFAHERDERPNPFTDYCMTVTFRHESGSPVYTVPGYFAADGRAADTGARSGTAWRAHLAPDKTGVWTYRISFLKGKHAAVGGSGARPLAPYHGRSGRFTVAETDKTGRDLRAKGRLEYVGKRYLRFADTGEYFLKQGADAPENLLAYADFDGDFKRDGRKDDLVKTWRPHVRDWRPGDPTWAGGKGKGLIGAINYLASEGMNTFSFLTLNIEGDDRNVFPYVSYTDRLHMDVSRLDQWEIVFEHADRMGMFLHFKTQETENECLLDGGDLGPERRLYYRELIARFAHHLALNWNLGEENGALGKVNQTTAQRRAMARFFAENDPYRHPVVVHNGRWPDDLLGSKSALAGFSLQTNRPDFANVHRRVVEWVEKSAKAGRPWVVACDEPGDAQHALLPDADDPAHDDARRHGLWGCLLGGGAGNEWYFGYKHAQSDLTCQDWRSRDRWWDQCRVALEFFRDHRVPFWEMEPRDDLVGNPKHENTVYCLAKPGEVYLVFLCRGGRAKVNLRGARGPLRLAWFNPRTGGALVPGRPERLTGGGVVEIGPPPAEADRDWLAVIRR